MRPLLLPLLLALGCAAAPPPREPGAPGGGRAREVRVTILSTMLAEAGIGEWGFAALVEVDGRRILFDTGERPRTVLENARELQLDLASASEVVLSHHHGDHTGGLLTLREALAPVSSAALTAAHVAPGFFAPRRERGGGEEEGNGMLAVRPRFEAQGGAFLEHARATELHPGVWLTGPIPRLHSERNWSGDGLVVLDGRAVEDTLPEDMALVIDTESGLIVVVGCGHAGIVNTLEAARRSVRDAPVLAVIGGLHLFPASDETLAWTAGELRARGIRYLLGAHCTGIEATFALREGAGLSRHTCAVGAVGATFSLKDGISPGVLAR